MNRSDEDFLKRLAIGPSFLFVGQAYGRLASGSDPLLQAAALRVGGPAEIVDYQAIGQLDDAEKSAFFDALAIEAKRSPTPEWLVEVTRFPWNGVITTAVDTQLASAFDAEWRRVVPLVGRDSRVSSPRSTTELKLRFLFGAAGFAEDERPPLDRLELAARKAEARDTLTDLAERILTPRGTVAIEGYAAGDWLEAEDLFAFLSRLSPGQAHLFSTADAYLDDEFLRAAVERKLLTIHASSLSRLLSEAEESGRLIRPPSSSGREERVITLGGQTFAMPRDIWNGIISTARPIDESILRVPAPCSDQLRYQRFRAFLDATDGPPAWSGLAAGFNFRRSFEAALFDKTHKALLEREVPAPLIVTGQAGSGKSMALASLAMNIARQGDFAVLHISRRPDRPSVVSIDAFALWAEENGAPATLLVWDGVSDPEEYHSMYRQLRARGRRVFIVGSAYARPGVREGAVLVPAHLEDDEPTRVQEWLSTFGVAIRNEDLPFVAADSSFLAALYRLLPESRRGISRGLVLELRTAESTMEQLGQNLRATAGEELGALADALRRAGLELPFFEPSQSENDERAEAFEDRGTAERLSMIVLVAGRRGLRIPLELALRTLGRSGSAEFIEILGQIDIIRWTEDESGEQALGTRNSLEASILARSDMRDARAEADVISAVLREIRPRSFGGGGPEVQFALDLITMIGPESDEKARFRRYYLEFSNALREVRVTSARAHPRLMLMEANLAREFAKSQQEGGSATSAERQAIFSEAQRVLEDALDLAPPGRGRLNLYVELASTIGARVYELTSDEGAESVEVASLVNQIVASVQEARAIEPENYYPVDVMGWVCIRLRSRDSLSEVDRMRIIADTMASFESIDVALLGPSQLARFDSRLSQVAQLFGDQALADEHLRRLEENGDPSAFFLVALKRSGLIDKTWDRNRGGDALNHLLSAPPAVYEDWRCARLMLDLFWLDLTGQRFLQGEREVLPFGPEEWTRCLDLVERFRLTSTFDRYRLDFLRGMALFHLAQFRQSLDIFSQLDRATTSLSRRIIATYLASTSDGVAVRYTGRIRTVTPDLRRGTVWVEELGIELPFTPYRFSLESPSRNDPLPEFHVAFNFRGPYADPVRVAKPKRQSTAPEERN